MRGNEFLDKMELIDPAYVEAADGKPKKQLSWVRWVAAAACLCLVFGTIAMFSRADETPSNLLPCKAVSETPPCRIGSSTIKATTLAKRYTFESAFSEADAVARIKVEGWIAEDTDICETYFEASVLQCFKGDMPDTFTLLQAGCSTGTLKGYPLFTGGNELLVFLNEATGAPYESSYWIIGAFTTFLDVSYDESGNRYYVDRKTFLGDSIGISTNYALQESICSEVYEWSVEADPVVADRTYFSYIFSEKDMINLFQELQCSLR